MINISLKKRIDIGHLISGRTFCKLTVMYHPRGRGGGRGSHHLPPSRPQSSKPFQRNSKRDFPQVHAKIRRHSEPTVEREVSLVTNAYRVIPAKPNLKIYEYELIVAPSVGCKDLPAKVLCRAFVSRSIRKLIMGTIVPTLTTANCPAGTILIEPNLEIIYTTKQFEASDEFKTTDQQEFRYENLSVETDLITNLYVDIIIKFSKSYTKNPKAYNGTLLSSILHHQLLIDMLKYGSVYYMMHSDLASQNASTSRMPDRLDLISQHLMGISISGAKRGSEDQTLVVINCSHSYITKSYRLIDLLACFIASKPVDNVELVHSLDELPQKLQSAHMKEIASITGSEDWFKSFCSILNGFKCQAMDNRGARVNLRFTLVEKSAKDLLVDEKTSVQMYYRNIGINLNYPNLPCLKSRSAQHPFYPLEMCSLLSGQKVPIFRLSTAARSHLTTVNKPKPDFSKHFSAKAKEEVENLNKNQFESFGVQLSCSPVEASGHTLVKPTLQYKNYRLEPQRDFWESGIFYQSVDLVGNWCVVDTVGVDCRLLDDFFQQLSAFSKKFGFNLGPPVTVGRSKQEIIEQSCTMDSIIRDCNKMTRGNLRFIMFIIDSSSTPLNRLVHLSFDEHPTVTATCLRTDSVLNQRQHRSIYRTLVHKLNARLGGTNVAYNEQTWNRFNLDYKGLMVVGLDVTHPDNELSGVSIVGCAFTYGNDLFRHKSLVWPQTARVEIIGRMDTLMQRLLFEYRDENNGHLPSHIVIYRDGVSHEEFERVRSIEITKASSVIDEVSRSNQQPRPNLSYVIAQKRHTMRFFQVLSQNEIHNPPGGTLIHQSVVTPNDCEFYLYSNTSPQATARPLHYHVLLNGLGMENLQKLTYYLCFNFGKCSSSLSMPSSLRYAHNAAYDARNRVIASKEFHENRFYSTKFFC